MAARARRRGFWPGLLTGLLLAAGAALALALALPPAPLQQPEIDPASLLPPAAPGAPEPSTEPVPGSPAGLLPETSGPLIENVPTLEAAPAAEPGAAGSSSLVPRE